MIKKDDRTMKVLMLLLLAVFLIIGGCGDKDDPVAPVNTSDDFTEAVAITQTQAAGLQAVTLVEQIDMLSVGVDSKDNKNDYLYNETKKQWEYTFGYTEAGFTYELKYTVQYRDGNGNAQRASSAASSLRHTMTGTGDYSYTDGGYTMTYEYAYAYDTTVTGIQTQTRVVTGTGSTVYDYAYAGNGLNQSNTYETNWATQGNGLSVPVDGCPTGTVRFNMDPYHYDVVFNNTSTATGTLYNAGGTVIPDGGNTHTLSCGTK